MAERVGPAGRRAGSTAGAAAGTRRVVCTRCGRPVTGRAWRSLTGAILHPQCTKGSTYLSDHLQEAARRPAPEAEVSAAERAWRKVLRRKA